MKLTEDTIVFEWNDEIGTYPVTLGELFDNIPKQILDNQKFCDVYRKDNLISVDVKYHTELVEKTELYLTETCGYCNEKMIVIGSRHVHACKHDLINKEKDEIIQENKQLKEQRDFLQNDLVDRSQKLEKIKTLTESGYYGDGLDLNNELKEILDQ